MRLNRLNEIEKYILSRGTVSIAEIAGKFAVSVNTVRRDLVQLIGRGQIRKVYGGVSVVADPPPPTSFTVQPVPERSCLNLADKKRICQLALDFVSDDMNVFVDSGSTCIWLFPHIARKGKLTIISHSLPALCEASQYPNLRIFSLGGVYYEPTSSFVGSQGIEAVGNMAIDLVFMATTGVSPQHGLMNNTYFENELKRAVVKSSKKIVLLADHTKFSRTALLPFASLSDLYAIVTDRALPLEYQQICQKCGIRVVTPDYPLEASGDD